MAEYSKAQLAHLNDSSLYRAMGIRLLRIENGEARSELRPTPALCWPFEGQPHGGLLFTQMDTTMATAVMTASAQRADNCATVNLDIQYTRPARGTVFICDVWTTHATGRTAFARSETRDENGDLVAAAQGTFRLVRTKST